MTSYVINLFGLPREAVAARLNRPQVHGLDRSRVSEIEHRGWQEEKASAIIFFGTKPTGSLESTRLLKNREKAKPFVLVAGLLWATILAYAGSIPAQASGQPGAAGPPEPQAQAGPNTAQPERGRSRGWHHFGESGDASPAAPSGSGVWRHFGANDPAPKVDLSPRPVPRQRFSGGTLAELEKQMYELVNRERSDPANAAETGGRALLLRWNERLAAVARAHSRDMLAQGYFDHVDPEGRDPYVRLKAAGIPLQAQGENIAIYGGIAEAEGAFMNEPRFEQNHRANILSRKYTDVGIGIVQAPDGRYYITQEFIESPSGLRPSGDGPRAAK